MTSTDLTGIKTALISVSDKTGLEALARALEAKGCVLWSTGGTARFLRECGCRVTDVTEITGFPEIMDGRVKTLHPKIHGALLAVAGNGEHDAAREAHGIAAIDLLVVNLYPFEVTLERGAGRDEIIENIDIGGPAMVRAAAKNHGRVSVLVDPADYGSFLTALEAGAGSVSLDLRQRLAAKAFAHTAHYDSRVAAWMAGEKGGEFPDTLHFMARKAADLRYGENPHQRAAAYRLPGSGAGLLDARQVQGKELSYNNLNDADAALEAVSAFDPAVQHACVIVKHANPCGVAVAENLTDAYRQALACDPVSAFGGILAFNRELDGETATEIAKIFTEVIIAPAATPAAMEVLANKKNLRLLILPQVSRPQAGGDMVVRSIRGGILVQSADHSSEDASSFTVATRRKPSAAEMQDLQFAWTVARHVKSNAIVFARDGATVGIGAGQMSRIDSTRIAIAKSLDAAQALGRSEALVRGSVAASDAFFPFADGVEAIAAAGATAIIQPGGAQRDSEVVAAADRLDLAMVFTGLRHFRH